MAERTIHVGNIPSHYDEGMIRSLFQACGAIEKVRIVGDPALPHRFCFIEFESQESVLSAMSFSGMFLGDKAIKISQSRSPIYGSPQLSVSNPNLNIAMTMSNAEKIQRTIYVAGIDVALTEEQVTQFFSSCGIVTACKLCGDTNHPKRFGFIEFATGDAAQKSISLSGMTLGSYPLKITPSKTPIQNPVLFTGPQSEAAQRTIFVGNLDVTVSENQLYEFFSALGGNVTKVIIAGDTNHPTRFAFVEFATREDCQASLKYSGVVIADKKIRISVSRTPILRTSIGGSNESELLQYQNLGYNYQYSDAQQGYYEQAIQNQLLQNNEYDYNSEYQLDSQQSAYQNLENFQNENNYDLNFQQVDPSQSQTHTDLQQQETTDPNEYYRQEHQQQNLAPPQGLHLSEDRESEAQSRHGQNNSIEKKEQNLNSQNNLQNIGYDSRDNIDPQLQHSHRQYNTGENHVISSGEKSSRDSHSLKDSKHSHDYSRKSDHKYRKSPRHSSSRRKRKGDIDDDSDNSKKDRKSKSDRSSEKRRSKHHHHSRHHKNSNSKSRSPSLSDHSVHDKQKNQDKKERSHSKHSPKRTNKD